MSATDFTGAKLALIHQDSLVTYLRDDTPDIPYPGRWDLAGGGREGEESPTDCALRETCEEFGLKLAPERICWQRGYRSNSDPKKLGYFMVAKITKEEIAAIRFGSEGQYWQMMPIDTFLRHHNAVPYLQSRLADYLAETADTGAS